MALPLYFISAQLLSLSSTIMNSDVLIQCIRSLCADACNVADL